MAKEKNKSARLRETVRQLQELPLERRPTAQEWEQLTSELTQDELEQLELMARGHLDRAKELVSGGDAEDVADEARSAILLLPLNSEWAQEVVESLRTKKWSGTQAVAFYTSVGQRQGRRRVSVPVWGWIALASLVMVPVGIVALFALGTQLEMIKPDQRLIGPRNLEAVFDTQGVKTNIQVAQSRLIIFPDATVAELSAWVTFPDHRVDVWEGTVDVLDGQGKTLTRREVTFRTSSEGPIEPGQGIEVFQQFDAWPWFDRVASFQVITTRILAQEAHPQNLKEMPLVGLETLGQGYNLRVWMKDSRWVDRFASKVHTLSLDLENSGLKPFAELQLALVWRDTGGKLLKTLVFRPVSAFRTALPSGARLGWTQESVFDTEVFSWPPGGEPNPVLELRLWQ